MTVGSHKMRMSPGGSTRIGRVTDQRTKPWQDAHVKNGKGIAQNGAWCIEADWETYNMEGGGQEVWHRWKMDVLCRNSAYEVISWSVSSAPEYHDLTAALKSPSAPSGLKKVEEVSTGAIQIRQTDSVQRGKGANDKAVQTPPGTYHMPTSRVG